MLFPFKVKLENETVPLEIVKKDSVNAGVHRADRQAHQRIFQAARRRQEVGAALRLQGDLHDGERGAGVCGGDPERKKEGALLQGVRQLHRRGGLRHLQTARRPRDLRGQRAERRDRAGKTARIQGCVPRPARGDQSHGGGRAQRHPHPRTARAHRRGEGRGGHPRDQSRR